MFGRSGYQILKNEPDPAKKEKSAFITQAISQPDARQEGTNVSLPSEANVREARTWVCHNKK